MFWRADFSLESKRRHEHCPRSIAICIAFSIAIQTSIFHSVFSHPHLNHISSSGISQKQTSLITAFSLSASASRPRVGEHGADRTHAQIRDQTRHAAVAPQGHAGSRYESHVQLHPHPPRVVHTPAINPACEYIHASALNPLLNAFTHSRIRTRTLPSIMYISAFHANFEISFARPTPLPLPFTPSHTRARAQSPRHPTCTISRPS